mmetsp:Transcript_21177/g.33200  ORF Transcript_21177/g.33200 Transcript_21177/m.33200 type:complete len:124 (+) Transcript_21177:228-599(+)
MNQWLELKEEGFVSSKNGFLKPEGTPDYMAPEVCKSQGCTPKSDIWSIGISLIVACRGARVEDQVYETEGNVILLLGLGRIQPTIPPCPALQTEFIRNCLALDPNLRMEANDLRAHEWIISQS